MFCTSYWPSSSWELKKAVRELPFSPFVILCQQLSWRPWVGLESERLDIPCALLQRQALEAAEAHAVYVLKGLKQCLGWEESKGWCVREICMESVLLF